MGRIQSSIGLITGTDIAGTVDQLMRINGQPRDRLVARTNTLQREQQALAELTASVIGVQLAGKNLSSLATFRSKAAESSNAESLSVTAGSGATSANHSVRTIQTAATHAVTSRARFDSDSTALGFTGSLALVPDGFLDQSSSLSELNNGRGVESGKIRITDRSGVSAEVDLTKAKTIDDVITAINDAKVDVVATTVDGRIKLVDQTGQTDSNLIVDQLGNDETAADLGLWGIDVAADSVTGNDLTFQVDANTDLDQLRQGKGVRFADGEDLTISLADGTSLNVDFGDFGGATQPAIQDVLDHLNSLDPAKLSASFTSEGIEVTDLTTGDNTFKISDATDSKAASDLGLTGSSNDSTIVAKFERQVLRGTRLEQLAGGSGITGLTSLDITTSNGDTASIDLSAATNTSEVIDAINSSGLNIIARLDESGTGLRLRDVSGGNGNFIISSADSTAQQLGLVANTEDDIVRGTSLAKQTVDRDTLVSSLNQGAGVTNGSFTITDSDGAVGAINLTTDGIETIGDLIDRINGLGIEVTASLNEAGDGISIIDNAGGTQTLTVANTGNGTAATELGIVGEATDQTIGGTAVSALVGTQNNQINIETSDSLASIVEKINAAERYGTASVILNDDGSYSLSVRSDQGGAEGRFGIQVNGFELNLDTTAKAQDAIIAVSTDGGSERLLTSSDGVFDLDATGAASTTVTAATSLADFASGATSGSFIVTDSDGKRSAINLTVQDIQTVGQLVTALNDLGLGLNASINDQGTGISIVDTAGGDETLTITDVGNSKAATSIGIVGEATEQTVNGSLVNALVGSGQSSDDAESSGVTLTLKQLSTEAITVTVSEDTQAITTAAKVFVNQYNKLVEKVDSLTFFNADTDEVGLLFGSSEAQRIRSGYSRLLSGAIKGAGAIRSVSQVGIRFTDKGKLNLDSGKLDDAIKSNRGDVEAFFTTDETGLASRLDDIAERIAGVDSSLLTNRRATLTRQVERNNGRIETLNSRLEKDRERLLLSFYRTEEAISKIQSNSSAIGQIQRISIPSRN